MAVWPLTDYCRDHICKGALVEKQRRDMEITRPDFLNRTNSKKPKTGGWYVEYFVHKRDVLRPGLQLNSPYQGRRAGVEEDEDQLRRVIIIGQCDPVTGPAVEHHGN